MASATPCPWWTVRNGIIVVCGQSPCPDRDNHRRHKELWSAKGLALGDRHEWKQWFQCPGWSVRNGVIVVCDQLSCPDRNKHLTHERNWSRAGLAAGDRHEMKHALPHAISLPCREWVITKDGLIGECLKSFIPKRTPCVKASKRDAKYGPCHPKGRNKELLHRHGYQLGASVRRICAYRNCDRGENGGKKIFDRVHRSPTGEYYCCEAHVQAERRLRKEDRWAEKLAKTHRLTNVEGLDLKTGLRATLAAHRALALGAKSQYDLAQDLAQDLYPDSTDPINATKQLLRRMKPVIKDEMQRVAKLDAGQRQPEWNEVKARLQHELAKPLKKAS